MKKFQIWGVLLALLIASTALTIALMSYLQQPKVAYVLSEELIYQYKGTLEAQNAFQQKTGAWQANVDTLKAELQREILKLNSNSEDQALLKRVRMKENQLKQYAAAIDQKARQEDEEMMQSVLNQVNSFVTQYAKENNYKIIFGATGSGSILYGEDMYNITDQVLRELNKHYEGN